MKFLYALMFTNTCTICSGVIYVYQDPDVLPESIKKLLPIQTSEGKNMTLEEYEAWRASQSAPSGSLEITGKKEYVLIY